MHHLDLKLLRSFAAVAEERSVTRAAGRLNLTQPTVSGQLKELEQVLGYLLFHRTSRRIALSEQGKRLLPLVQALLQSAEEVRQEAYAMQEASKRSFKLGAAMYTMDFRDRIELLEAFNDGWPNLHFTIDNRLQSDQVRDLLSGKLDAALHFGIAVEQPVEAFMRAIPSGNIVNESQIPSTLERLVLRRRRVGLLVPETSAFAYEDIIPARALEGHRIVMLSGEHGNEVVDPMASFVLGLGAVPVTVAEGNALAIERYAQRNQCCAIGIGWFPTPEGMVWRQVEGMDFYFDLSVVLGANPNKAARRFFQFATAWQNERATGIETAGPARCVSLGTRQEIGKALH